ncbi:MAG TPA: hypothetical protein VF505_13930, partial [Thermoanaerobaculia bacterium]
DPSVAATGIGALLNARAQNPALTVVFGVLLLFAGIANVTSFAQRMRFGPKTAWLAGGVARFRDSEGKLCSNGDRDRAGRCSRGSYPSSSRRQVFASEHSVA